MKNKYSMALSALALLSSPLTFAQSIDNQALSYYCGNDNVEYEKKITVGKGTRVYLNEGSFYQIEQEGEYNATLDFINKQIVSSGVSEECSEFLLTNGFLQSMDSGEVMARVYFDFDRASLTDKSKYVLGNIIKLLKNNGKNLTLEGHSDSIGDEKYNFALGLKRSESVEKYLISHGIEQNRLDSISAGELKPIASNNDEKSREQNRRVEIK
ncbi:outer membrane protein, OmpA family [Aliivibrio wodanis]|uniref:Outer membrane protein, OmpA family n=1 Tax=Aliivibrio wodanis TaxID=80852 RepID=A0A090I7F8_9GAMM|nr:outer membrane protein, OmpA family [Aliivibrio wodanis]VVV05875.1 Outer membrane lipoprotein Omp16 [Aliivibrio wodanis]